MAKRPPRCAAICGYKNSYQVEYRQQCQQSAAHYVDGVGLCGTHFNAASRGPIMVLTHLEVSEGNREVPQRVGAGPGRRQADRHGCGGVRS